MEDVVKTHLKQLHVDRENAYFSLIDLSPNVVPHLIRAYHDTNNIAEKEFLVEATIEFRLPESLDFLAEVLREEADSLWKIALDGMVTIGSRRSLELLIAEKQRLLSLDSIPAIRIEWVEEAIAQVSEGA